MSRMLSRKYVHTPSNFTNIVNHLMLLCFCVYDIHYSTSLSKTFQWEIINSVCFWLKLAEGCFLLTRKQQLRNGLYSNSRPKYLSNLCRPQLVYYSV